MKTLLREPLIHFLLIGAALFFLFEVFETRKEVQGNRIVISNGQIEFLKASFARTRQRVPTGQELQGLIDGFVREEVYYREALSLGMDKDDFVIRRRLGQKFELMSDDLAGIKTPSEEELQAFLQTNQELFKIDAQIAFRHVFIDVAKRGKPADDEAARLLAVLSAKEKATNPDLLGDPLMIPKKFSLTPLGEIAKFFGESFSLELEKYKPGQWSGPVQSGYGLHLVRVTEYIAEKLPHLDEIRKIVEWEWAESYRKDLKDSIYEKLREKYTVVVEQHAGGGKTIQAASASRTSQMK